MKIGDRLIDDGCYIIAELGVNHDGAVERALSLTRAAAAAGADAVKLQLFEADRLMSRASKLAAYQRAAGERDPLDMLKRLELSLEQMAQVVDLAHAAGLHAIVTVFSTELVEPALGLGFDAFKTASPDIIHRPLLRALAGTGKPLILSTGAATSEEISRALGWLGPGAANVALLQCVSSYPTPPAHASLAGMCALGSLFAGPIGYSDHTEADDTSRLAFDLGANILEKHLTHDRAAAGPDHRASLDPAGLARYVNAVRARSRAVTRPPADPAAARLADPADPRFGPPEKRVLEIEREVRRVSRQSIVSTRPMLPGHVVRRSDITVKRPGTGLAPEHFEHIIGCRLARALESDVPLTADDLEPAARAATRA